MAAGDTDALTMRGHSAAWVRPVTLSGNDITAIGAEVQFKAVTVHEGLGAAAAGAAGAADETVDLQLADGVTIQVNRVTRLVEGTTGANKAVAAAGGGTAVDLIRFTSA